MAWQPNPLNYILFWSLACCCYGAQIKCFRCFSFSWGQNAISSHIPRKMCHLSSLFQEYRCAHYYYYCYIYIYFFYRSVYVRKSFRWAFKIFGRRCSRKYAALYIDSFNLWLANLYFPIFPWKLISCFCKNIKDISKLDSIYVLIFLPCPGWKMSLLDHHQ